jgi:hypothetical protein
MTRNPFRHNLRFGGPGRYEITLHTRGWVDRVEASGLSLEDRQETLESGRRLMLRLRVPAGQERDVAFSVRPVGVPVFLEGMRDGRPLKPADVRIGPQSMQPDVIPYRLPQTESEDEAATHFFSPPPAAGAGVLVWLTPDAGRQFLEFDQATCEQMKALGYVGQCGG